jgi:hypothetical protein
MKKWFSELWLPPLFLRVLRTKSLDARWNQILAEDEFIPLDEL